MGNGLETIKEKAMKMTLEEFMESYVTSGLCIDGFEYSCPSACGLRERCQDSCNKCWRESLSTLDFINPMGKDFKKSDLRSGMWVQYRNGEFRLVLLNSFNKGSILCSLEHTGWGDLDDFSENMRLDDNVSNALDIMKVYKPKFFMDILSHNIKDMELLWERKENINICPKQGEFTHRLKNGGVFNFVAKENRIIYISSKGFKGVSSCDPNDMFDLDFGCQLAYSRAMEKYYAHEISELIKTIK